MDGGVDGGQVPSAVSVTHVVVESVSLRAHDVDSELELFLASIPPSHRAVHVVKEEVTPPPRLKVSEF